MTQNSEERSKCNTPTEYNTPCESNKVRVRKCLENIVADANNNAMSVLVLLQNIEHDHQLELQALRAKLNAEKATSVEQYQTKLRATEDVARKATKDLKDVLDKFAKTQAELITRNADSANDKRAYGDAFSIIQALAGLNIEDTYAFIRGVDQGDLDKWVVSKTAHKTAMHIVDRHNTFDYETQSPEE